MAVPGPIDSPRSEGTNQLIKDGARMVTGAEDVIEELFGVAGSGLDAVGLKSTARPAAEPALSHPSFPLVTPDEGSVLRTLETGPLHVDALAGRIGMRSSDALVVLLDLELRGLVQSAPGMRWVKAIGGRDFPVRGG
jgi:DNA processing protein